MSKRFVVLTDLENCSAHTNSLLVHTNAVTYLIFTTDV